MDSIDLTVIIPVYNTVDYIKRCLDSLIKQTYKNFKITLIDDGSTDGSEKICDEYGKSFSFIKVVHKNNEGVSKARNLGLELLNTPYFMFMDSDDYLLNEKTIELNISILKEDNSIDIVQFPFIFLEDAFSSFTCNEKGLITGSVDIFQAMFLNKRINGYVNGKIYRSIPKLNFKFREDFRLCEDSFFFMDIINKLEKIYISGKGGYGYEIRENSLCRVWDSETSIQFSKNVLRIYELCCYFKLSPKWRTKFWIESNYWILGSYINGGLKAKKEVLKMNNLLDKYGGEFSTELLNEKQKRHLKLLKIIGRKNYIRLFYMIFRIKKFLK